MSNDKAYWVKKYIKAKEEGNDIARRRAYRELIRIMGNGLKEKDIR